MSSEYNIINLKVIEKSSRRKFSFKKLKKCIPSTHMDDNVIAFLETYIGNCCCKLEIEYPYLDRDYLSTVYTYYIKATKEISKYCYRLHIYNEKEYMGYIVLRPTPYSHIGRVQMKPEVFLKSKNAYVITSEFKCNVMGEDRSVKCFQFSKQDPIVAMCAQVSTWAVIRHMHNLGLNYFDMKIAEITDRSRTFTERKIPAKGLSGNHIMEILSSANLHPIMRGGMRGNPVNIGEIFAYIESGFPIIALIPSENHAITIIGHSSIEEIPLDSHTNTNDFLEDYYLKAGDKKLPIIMHHKFISSFIVNDDNFAPYQELPIKTSFSQSNSIIPYMFSSIEAFIVPLSEKMYISYDAVYSKTIAYLSSQAVEDFPSPSVLRIYLVSSNSFKSQAHYNLAENLSLLKVICSVNLSRFIWVVEISSAENYNNKKVDCLMIYDATRHVSDERPWVIIQSKNSIHFFNGKKFRIIKKITTPYPQYTNNLEGINQ